MDEKELLEKQGMDDVVSQDGKTAEILDTGGIKPEDIRTEDIKPENRNMENINMGNETPMAEEVSAETRKLWKKSEWKAYNFMGIALFLFFAVSSVLQLINRYGLRRIVPTTVVSDNVFTLLNVIIPLHIVGFALYFLITLGREKKVPEKHSMKFGQFIVAILMAAGLCLIGTIVGNIINTVLVLILSWGSNNMNAGGLETLMLESNFFLRLLVVGISAPIVEEMIFRKILIDRVAKYGELAAILISGIFFGMFHGNFTQAIFATLLGMFFAFIYLRTGRVWYTIGIHMAINLTTSVLTIPLIKPFMSKCSDPAFLQMMQVNPEQYLGEILLPMLITLVWVGFLGTVANVGIVLWIVMLVKKKLYLKKAECQVKGGFWVALGTVGSILFLLSTTMIFCFQYGSVFVAAHFK